jgi:hypothetical protein
LIWQLEQQQRLLEAELQAHAEVRGDPSRLLSLPHRAACLLLAGALGVLDRGPLALGGSTTVTTGGG